MLQRGLQAVVLSVLVANTARTALLSGDFDCDGVRDTAQAGWNRTHVTLRVTFANRSHRAQVFDFPVDSFREDGVCRVPVVLRVERHGKCASFAMIDEACDSFHFYWDAKAGKLAWWRL